MYKCILQGYSTKAFKKEKLKIKQIKGNIMTKENTCLLQVSPLLTNNEIDKALSKWFKESITFSHWEYVSDTEQFNSNLSDVIRIIIYGQTNGQNKHVQVVLKTIPKNVCRRLTFRSDDFFRNEINIYQNVLPALLKFQSEKQVTNPFTNYTKVFLALSDGINDVICLEDASLENYGSPVRQEGIDYEHFKLTSEVLAKFHALSFAMRDQRPEEFAKISNTVLETYYDPKYWDWYERFWKRISGIAIDAVDKEFPDTIYVEKVKEFAVPERYQDMIKAVQDKTNGVISHGDCWTTNFLYKYENGTAVDAKMIDFQLSRYASPVLDLSFCTYACTEQELRLKHYDNILKNYYNVLSKQITELGSCPEKVYSWDSFIGEVKKYSYFGLAFSFESTPSIVLDSDDDSDDEIEMEGNEKKNIDDFWDLSPIETKKGRLREANNVVHCVDNDYI